MDNKNTKPKKYKTPDEVKEEVRNLIKNFMRNNGITAQNLANTLSEKYNRSASRTNILNKLFRASFSLAEFMQIVEAYGYEITLVKTDRTTSDRTDS